MIESPNSSSSSKKYVPNQYNHDFDFYIDEPTDPYVVLPTSSSSSSSSGSSSCSCTCASCDKNANANANANIVFSDNDGSNNSCPKTCTVIFPERRVKRRQERYMQRAAELALNSTITHQHGCVIVHNNTIVAQGWNIDSPHMKRVNSLHAELHAIMQLRGYSKQFMSKCDMYVVRVGRVSQGRPMKLSKPCDNCMAVIRRCGINKIYYSTNAEYENYVKNMTMPIPIPDPPCESLFAEEF